MGSPYEAAASPSGLTKKKKKLRMESICFRAHSSIRIHITFIPTCIEINAFGIIIIIIILGEER